MWLDIAKELPLGHKTRVNCECGDGKTLVINHNIKGFSCHCFRCDVNEFIGKGKQTLEELARIKELNELSKEELPLQLPDDFTQDIPLHGRLWLYSGGITEPTWKQYNIGYSKKYDRVILPVYDNNKLIWYQCRALHEGQVPKYIQPSRGRESIVFTSKGGKNNGRAVLVEDILSAIRVGKHIRTYSLLGTKISTNQANILAKHSHVTTWLDADKAGRVGAYKIRKTMSLLTEVTDIVTAVDPKKLSDKEIKEVLYGYN